MRQFENMSKTAVSTGASGKRVRFIDGNNPENAVAGDAAAADEGGNQLLHGRQDGNSEDFDEDDDDDDDEDEEMQE